MGFLQFIALALAMVSPKAERISCQNRICASALPWVQGVTGSLLLLLLVSLALLLLLVSKNNLN